MNRRLFFAALTLSAAAFAQSSVNADGPYQVRYAANLNLGDSYINLTNSAASGGNICVGVYTFSPDEQLVSCCSCVVTPNALKSLSVKGDLISNTLTPAVPTAVVVKLVATTGATCNAATSTNLATGLLAWGTSLHLIPLAAGMPATAIAIEGSAFSTATLSSPEFTRMTNLCSFIQSNGSGYGICRSCRLGGLGASQK
jgi:hypothetical protein